MASTCPACHLQVVSSDGNGKTAFCSFGCCIIKGPRFLLLARLGLGFLATPAVFLLLRSREVYMPFSATGVSLLLSAIVILFLSVPVLKFFFHHNPVGHVAELMLVTALFSTFGYCMFLFFRGGEPAVYGNLLILIPLASTLFYIVALAESSVKQRCSEDIHHMLFLRPSKARLQSRSQEVETATKDLKEGDSIFVRAGEIIPADGAIVLGTTSVDESLFTAEQTILFKKKGDRVTAGSLNRDSSIIVKLDLPPEKHFLQRIISSVSGAILPAVEWPAKIAVLTVAGGLVYGGITVFGVLNPVSLVSGIILILIMAGFAGWPRIATLVTASFAGNAARHGIIIRSSGLLKRLSKMNWLFFGKTGTLTQGHFFFSELFLENGVNQGTFLSTAFSLEACSEHPLAAGMKTHPWYLEIPLCAVKNFRVHKGLGICGDVCYQGKPERFAAVGNQRFIKRLQMQISRSMRERLEDLESMGETVVLCGWGGQVMGLLSFADTLQPEVKTLFSRLRKMHVSPVMITGDHDEMFAHLAHTQGLKQIYTRCLPEEKAAKIQARQKQGYIVGMVGNSADEECALKQADAGIIVGTGTAPVEIPAAGVVVLGKSLLKIASLIHYSRKLQRAVNLGLALTFTGGIALLAMVFSGILSTIWFVLFTAFLAIALNLLPLCLERAQL